ncbi:MAG: Secretion system C-terminal sorting domain, partial [Bacteroidota bacterium]
MKPFQLNYFFLSILFLFAYYNVSVAQNMDTTQKIRLNTTNAASGTYLSKKIGIDWNFGELFTVTLKDNINAVLTTGFLQSMEVEFITASNSNLAHLTLDTVKLLFPIYPNPTSNFVSIKNPTSIVKIVEMNVFDFKGVNVYSITKPYSTPSYTKLVYLAHLLPGNYFIQVKYIVNQIYA